VTFLGSKSGFKTGRDLVTFLAGLGIIIYQFLKLPPDKINIPILLFAASLMGVPYVLARDEQKQEANKEKVVRATIADVYPDKEVEPLPPRRSPKQGAKKTVARKKPVKKSPSASKKPGTTKRRG
jgi:hypothetical protein